MSIRASTTRSEWSANAGKSYVTTGNFSGAFYTYTTSLDSSYQPSGTLTTVATPANATAPTTPFATGHQLVLTGRKLTPGVNPMNFITGNSTATNNPYVSGSTPGQALVSLSPSGVGATTATTTSSPPAYAPKFMVSVTDVHTGLNGFIDPSNPLFVLYDSNRPISDYLSDMATGLTNEKAEASMPSGQGALGGGGGAQASSPIVLGPLALNSTTPIGDATSGSVTMTPFKGISAPHGVTATYTFTSSSIKSTSIVILTPISNMVVVSLNLLVGYFVTVTTGQFTISINGSGVTTFGGPDDNTNAAFNFLILN